MSEHHHVRFDAQAANDESTVEKQISSTLIEPGVIAVHCGFLQINHRYNLSFTIPNSLCSIQNLQPIDAKCRNLVYKIMEFSEDISGYKFKLDLNAFKENTLEETLVLRQHTSGELVKLILRATVIGKGKGTPMLRKGVRSIEIVDDTRSESDN